MAAQLYSNAAVYIQGALLLEATSVTVDRKTGAQPQLTLAGGFTGMSPGAPMIEISFANAVPAIGMEFDPGKVMKLLMTTAFTVFAANRSLTTTGFITEDSFKKAANSEAALDIKMTCVFAEWQ